MIFLKKAIESKKMFVKGKSGNPNGKKKGTLSKETTRFKAALNELLESQADKMVLWLEEIDNPKQRFDVIKDLAEYIHPKLARTDTTLTGADGGAIKVHTINVNLIDKP